MKIPRMITVSAAVGTALAFVRPIITMAATGPAPAGAEVVASDPFDPTFGVGLAIVAAVVVFVAVVAISRPGSRRPIAALLTVLVSAVVALAFVLAALLSDWSGEHRVSPIPLVIGIVVLILGLYVAIRLFNRPSDERGQ